MNSEVLWILIGVTVGALLTWLFEELSQYSRYRGERRRIINKVLYSLLNIRFELVKINYNRNSKEVLRVIEKFTNEEIPEQLRSQIESRISNTSSELLESSVFDNLLEIGGELKSVLLVYSEIEPAGAYRLSDEGKYLLNLNELKKYLASVKEKFSDSETPVDYIEFHHCIKNKMIFDSVRSLKKEISILSKKTRKITRDQIIQTLTKQDNLSIEESGFEECIQIMFNETLN
jgi:hypothetical protein